MGTQGFNHGVYIHQKFLLLSWSDFDAVFGGKKKNPNSVLSKFFGLIRFDISMLGSNSSHFIRWLAEAFSSAVLQKHNGLLHC